MENIFRPGPPRAGRGAGGLGIPTLADARAPERHIFRPGPARRGRARARHASRVSKCSPPLALARCPLAPFGARHAGRRKRPGRRRARRPRRRPTRSLCRSPSPPQRPRDRARSCPAATWPRCASGRPSVPPCSGAGAVAPCCDARARAARGRVIRPPRRRPRRRPRAAVRLVGRSMTWPPPEYLAKKPESLLEPSSAAVECIHRIGSCGGPKGSASWYLIS